MQQTYPSESVEAVRVALLNLHALATCIPPVPIEDERDVLWYWSRREDRYQSTLRFGGRLVSDPAEGGGDELWQHVVGNQRNAMRVLKFAERA